MMDEVDKEKVIRAPSLKRGKTEERITDRVFVARKAVSVDGGVFQLMKNSYERRESRDKVGKENFETLAISKLVPSEKRNLKSRGSDARTQRSCRKPRRKLSSHKGKVRPSFISKWKNYLASLYNIGETVAEFFSPPKLLVCEELFPSPK
ncbi:hypothetical protein HHI36_022461 [Cryptolaemus montrouzieri]|uniref:Uncharacterized protein n=1 Tax=Cryptolaemus montrouzieri TaxID=559131 RepID=A0ABD2MZV8_9CUCU